MRLDAHANASCLTYEVAVEIGRIPHCRKAMGKSVRVFHRISLFSDVSCDIRQRRVHTPTYYTGHLFERDFGRLCFYKFARRMLWVRMRCMRVRSRSFIHSFLYSTHDCTAHMHAHTHTKHTPAHANIFRILSIHISYPCTYIK